MNSAAKKKTATMFTSQIKQLTGALLVFVLVKFGEAFIPEFECMKTCQNLQDEKFNNYCHKFGSCDWYCAGQRMNCSAPSKYHCARANGYPEHQFFNVCAIPKLCRKGQEPSITAPNKQAEVNCIPCVDKTFYNDLDNQTSSTFSQCPYKKYYPCTKEQHKIDCGPERGKQAWDVQTEGDGFCRCDARGGYEPKYKDVLDKGEYCFDKKVDCVKKDCGPGMELSLTYICIPKCPEGLVRTQLSDMCSQLEISSPPSTPVSVLPTSTNRTETVTMSPNPQNSTLGPTPDEVNKTALITICVLFAISIVIISGYIVYKTTNICKKKKTADPIEIEVEEALLNPTETTEEKKKEDPKEVEQGPINPNETTAERNLSLERHDKSKGRSSDAAVTSNIQPSTQYNKTYNNINYYGVVYKVKDGKSNINNYGDDQKVTLVRKKGTASNERLEEDTDLFSWTRRSSSIPDFQAGHGSSTGSLESCNSAAGTLPSKPVLPKEGRDLRMSVPTEIPVSVAYHPTDDVETKSDDRDKLQERIPAGINEKDFKPVNLRQRQGPDADGDVTYVDEEATLDEKMERLAEDLLNKTNICLNEFSASNEEDLATIQSKLDKIPSSLKQVAAEKNVNLDKMLTFPMCVQKPPIRFIDLFKCEKCGKMFVRGNSSGKNNSCMYQSISLLLCGEEHLQNRLRLCSTLHAVERFKDYVKQLEAFAGKEENPLERVLKILCPAGVNSHDSKDWKVELQAGIMKIVVETSELNQNCSQLHIMFLSHALRCKITQHFEEISHHEDTEDCPVLENDTAIPSDILDLHILWNKQCNHMMPLYKM